VSVIVNPPYGFSCGAGAPLVHVDPHPIQREPGVLLRVRTTDRPGLGVETSGERRREARQDEPHDGHDRQELEERVAVLLPKAGTHQPARPGEPQMSHRIDDRHAHLSS